MKRGYLGMALLGAILLLSILISGISARRAEPIHENLEQAAGAALRGDWQKTAALTGKARAAWEDGKFYFSCFAHQDEVRDIDSLFGQLEIYQSAREGPGCSALCVMLENLTRELQEDQCLNLHHLL